MIPEGVQAMRKSSVRVGIPRRLWIQAGMGGMLFFKELFVDQGAIVACRRFELTPKLGYSLYGMKALSLIESIKICARIGYRGVELPVMPSWPGDPDKMSAWQRREVQQALSDNNIQLQGLMENVQITTEAAKNRLALERLKRAAELGRTLAPNQPPLVETTLGGKPQDWEEQRSRYVQILCEWAQAARLDDFVIAVKAHALQSLRSSKDVSWLMTQVADPYIRVNFDYSHFERLNEPLDEAYSRLADWVVFIHLKDNIKYNDEWLFSPPGTGSTNYAQYAKLLNQHHYHGPVVVEISAQVQNKQGYNAVALAEQCYARLAAHFID